MAKRKPLQTRFYSETEVAHALFLKWPARDQQRTNTSTVGGPINQSSFSVGFRIPELSLVISAATRKAIYDRHTKQKHSPGAEPELAGDQHSHACRRILPNGDERRDCSRH